MSVCQKYFKNTHLLLLLVEIVYDDTNKQVEGEEGPEDDEDDKVEIHVQAFFILRLQLHLPEESILLTARAALNVETTLIPFHIVDFIPSNQSVDFLPKSTASKEKKNP